MMGDRYSERTLDRPGTGMSPQTRTRTYTQEHSPVSGSSDINAGTQTSHLGQHMGPVYMTYTLTEVI